MDKSRFIYYQAKLTFPADKPAAMNNPLPLFQRQTNRFAYHKRPIAKRQLHAIQSLVAAPMHIQVIDDNEKIRQISQLVGVASEIRFKTREIHEWFSQSLRFGKQAEQSRDGLDVSTLDLPPGGALFLRFMGNWRRMQWLNRLGASKLMAKVECDRIKEAPALVAVTGATGFDSVIAAGRMMQRLWIELNTNGVAVQPYYVISDQLN